MKILIALFVVLLLGGSCAYAYTVSPSDALHKVEDAGYNNVHIGSRHVWDAEWRCGKGYEVYFTFTATAANGRTVTGRACKGSPGMGWRINY